MHRLVRLANKLYSGQVIIFVLQAIGQGSSSNFTRVVVINNTVENTPTPAADIITSDTTPTQGAPAARKEKAKRKNLKRGQPQHTKGPRRGRRNKVSSMDAATRRLQRCTRCILTRKSCDGRKPICGLCNTGKRGPHNCEWPEGDPTRGELEAVNRAAMQGDGMEEEEEEDNGNCAGLVEGSQRAESSGQAEQNQNLQDITEEGIDPDTVRTLLNLTTEGRPLHTEGALAGLPDFTDMEEQPLPEGDEGERMWREIKDHFLTFLDPGVPGWKPPKEPTT